ncbi:MAG: immune inhibitor A, partial [Myxococcales bacterium]|nr:immune inhibitor A [Myxococcales bacterium]
MRRLALSLLSSPLIALAVAAPAVAAPGGGLDHARARLMDDLAHLRFEALGNPVTRWDHLPPVHAPEAEPHKQLVVLVRFSDLGFERYQGDQAQDQKLAAWYQDKLFDPRYEKPNTLSHYYHRQSLGTYHLQGHVLPPVTLSKTRADYGRSYRQMGGDWRNDKDPEGLVEEALTLVAQANPGLDWASFDRWDPQDFDGDGILNEPDGYLDHLVLVYAGNGQSSCHGLYGLQRKLDPNADMDVLKTLDPRELECVDRLWPHRFKIQKREDQGPVVEGRMHVRGGMQIRPGLWSLDYNMQSEYTEPSTFIHEFGHSIGLPDIYARTSNNSTGGWEVMSATSSPVAQNMSAWSRIQLGWLNPRVVLPPAFGGQKVQSVYLRRLDEALDAVPTAHRKRAAGLHRAALVALPPKRQQVKLATPPQGQQGLYSGQGNHLSQTAALRLDLSKAQQGQPIALSFDAWWQIEAGWDFAYVEVRAGDAWERIQTSDKRFMPAKHGHDGKHTLPGFTGLSGDLDGDGKNESAQGCDPSEKIAHGEDKAGQKESPCKAATWVRPSFDLSPYAGRTVTVRIRYFTDMAAVEPGILIDDLKVTQGDTVLFADDFEGERRPRAWQLDGWTPSAGEHTLLVPHYYVLEFRDPYAEGSYDNGLGDQGYRFFWDVKLGRLRALRVRPRPGVLAWYFDGAYAWSENDPATNGPGRGSLLALDAWPNETPIPGLEDMARGQFEAFDTHYDVKAEADQKTLQAAFRETVCAVRNPDYRPVDLDAEALGGACPQDTAFIDTLTVDGKQLVFGYELVNRFLPGPEREKRDGVSELYDYKTAPKKPAFWRLRDRSLRYLH